MSFQGFARRNGSLKYTIIPTNDSLTERLNNYASLNEAFGNATVILFIVINAFCVIAKGRVYT